MAKRLPYLSTPGVVTSIFNKIIEAATPERFTQDFLAETLSASGGSARAIIPVLKRVGMLQEDGSPTDLYKKFRNAETRGAAMAAAIRIGYKDLFDRNERADKLSREKIAEFVNEISGKEKGNSVDSQTVSTFFNLTAFANFEEKMDGISKSEAITPSEDVMNYENNQPTEMSSARKNEVDTPLTLAYSINLHLPETDDITVFDAIFKSLNANILKKFDG